MAWVLDTNIVVFCLRGKSPAAMRNLHAVPAAEVIIPCQVLAELLLGAAKSAKPAKNTEAVLAFLAPFKISWPTRTTVDQYVALRADLENKGKLIGEADLWIAATAMESTAVMVTNNTDEFARVPGLVVADWTQE